jgi:hypothetical protein
MQSILVETKSKLTDQWAVRSFYCSELYERNFILHQINKIYSDEFKYLGGKILKNSHARNAWRTYTKVTSLRKRICT